MKANRLCKLRVIGEVICRNSLFWLREWSFNFRHGEKWISESWREFKFFKASDHLVTNFVSKNLFCGRLEKEKLITYGRLTRKRLSNIQYSETWMSDIGGFFQVQDDGLDFDKATTSLIHLRNILLPILSCIQNYFIYFLKKKQDLEKQSR